MSTDYNVNNIFNNNKVNSITLYLLLFFTIILSRDTLVVSIKVGFYKSLAIYIILIAIIVLAIFKTNKLKININNKSIWAASILVLLISISSLLKLDFQFYIVSIIFYIVVAVIFTHIFTFDDFNKKLSNIMVFLGIYSLISCYLIKPILFPDGLINEAFNIVQNSAELNFFDLGLSYVVALPYYIRNFGIFREPGIYQFFLLIPFIYELLLRKDKFRVWNISILFITIISTFSLPGIVVMFSVILILLIKIMLDIKLTKKMVYIGIGTLIGFIIIMVLLYYANANFKSVINEMIKKITTVNESSSARVGSIVNNFKLFFTSPIFGHDFSIVQASSEHNTNSTFSLLAMFGIGVGIVHIWYQYLISKIISKNKMIQIMSLCMLILMVNTQFLLGNTMFWILTFVPFMVQDEEYNKMWDAKKYICECKKKVLTKIELLKNK